MKWTMRCEDGGDTYEVTMTGDVWAGLDCFQAIIDAVGEEKHVSMRDKRDLEPVKWKISKPAPPKKAKPIKK